MENKVLEAINKFNMLSVGDKVVVAVSGGPDSIALLNSLNNLKEKLNVDLFVAHVNHMIRAVADSETEYVKAFCESRNIKCFVKKVDVLKKAEEEKISTEEAGRNARYEFFEEVFKEVNANKIAIAHNANDNAETVLMNIMRGSGISGLKGIEPIRDGKYIRPLIEIERTEIEQYCNENNLAPKYDESNKENIYTRNKIRNLLIPYLQREFNPSIIEALNRMSKLASEEQKYVDEIVDKEFFSVLKKDYISDNKEHNNCCDSENQNNNGEIIIDLKKFNSKDKFIKNKIIMYSIYRLFGTTKGIEKKHVDDIVKLCERNIGNKYLTPNKNTKIFVGKGEIKICKLPNCA